MHGCGCFGGVDDGVVLWLIVWFWDGGLTVWKFSANRRLKGPAPLLGWGGLTEEKRGFAARQELESGHSPDTRHLQRSIHLDDKTIN
jgi:hypothetical protein